MKKLAITTPEYKSGIWTESFKFWTLISKHTFVCSNSDWWISSDVSLFFFFFFFFLGLSFLSLGALLLEPASSVSKRRRFWPFPEITSRSWSWPWLWPGSWPWSWSSAGAPWWSWFASRSLRSERLSSLSLKSLRSELMSSLFLELIKSTFLRRCNSHCSQQILQCFANTSELASSNYPLIQNQLRDNLPLLAM